VDPGVTAPAPLIDCHSDIIIDIHRRRAQGEGRVFERVHLPALRAGGVAASICTVGGDPACLCPLGTSNPFESALALVDTLRRDLALSAGARIAGCAEDVRRLLADDIFAIVPALEGAAPLRGDPALVEEFYAIGIRSIGLTWNSRNEVAVGLRSGDGGLSETGRAVIREMNRIGMLVDVAHATPATFWDVVAVAEAPFVASHANARSLQDHPRNLDDDQLRAICDVGGLVGVVLFPLYVGPQPVTIEHVLDQIEFLVDKVGVESVGIGADFIDYAVEEVVAGYVERGVPHEEYLAHFLYPAGVETCRSLSRLLDGMERRGFAPDAIRKIASENILRVLTDVEQAAS
jgi:membrane dipeptidase